MPRVARLLAFWPTSTDFLFQTAARRSARVECVQRLCRYHLACQRVEALRCVRFPNETLCHLLPIETLCLFSLHSPLREGGGSPVEGKAQAKPSVCSPRHFGPSFAVVETPTSVIRRGQVHSATHPPHL